MLTFFLQTLLIDWARVQVTKLFSLLQTPLIDWARVQVTKLFIFSIDSSDRLGQSSCNKTIFLFIDSSDKVGLSLCYKTLFSFLYLLQTPQTEFRLQNSLFLVYSILQPSGSELMLQKSFSYLQTTKKCVDLGFVHVF